MYVCVCCVCVSLLCNFRQFHRQAITTVHIYIFSKGKTISSICRFYLTCVSTKHTDFFVYGLAHSLPHHRSAHTRHVRACVTSFCDLRARHNASTRLRLINRRRCLHHTRAGSRTITIFTSTRDGARTSVVNGDEAFASSDLREANEDALSRIFFCPRLPKVYFSFTSPLPRDSFKHISV